jgi:NAD-dependent SIR2 family protein deacetylase
MSKLGFIAAIASLLGALTFATLSSPADADGTACVHTEFKTELVKQACEKGGQKEAKDAMKAFMKDKKIKSCNQCHAKLAPKYELKADGLEQFTKAGGK